MKLKGRESNAWHKNINVAAGPGKPTDVDFPWIKLRNHTGYYLKKKGFLSQCQTDERLLDLIRNHSSKGVAIAACAHHITTRALRNLVVNDLKVEPNGAFGLHEYSQAIVATNHANPEAVSDIEAQWARYLSENPAHSGSSRTLGQQLQDMLPLLLDQVASGLLLQTETNSLACRVCLGFATQLEVLRHRNRWEDAYVAAGWLSTISSSGLLLIPNLGAGQLLNTHLPTWEAWAAWRPSVVRLHAWNDYAVRAPLSLGDLLALEGPDFASMIGSAQASLRNGLIAQGIGGSQTTLHWGNSHVRFGRNPFIDSGNLNGILDRLTSVVDFACSAGGDYTALLVHLCVGKTITHENLQILEETRLLDKPPLTRVILQAFTLPSQYFVSGIEEIIELLLALRDPRLDGLRERIKGYPFDWIANYVRKLQNTFLQQIDAENGWKDSARELLTFYYRLQEQTWLVAEFDHSAQDLIASRPPWVTIETLGVIRNSIWSVTSSAATPLRSQVDAYCRALLVPGWTVSPHVRGLVEALIDLWKQNRDEKRLELALLVADFPNTSCQFRCDCLGDLTTLSYPLVISTLRVLKFPNGDPDTGVFTLIRLMASENMLSALERWRQILLVVIEQQHETLLRHAVTNLGAEMWLELLNCIRAIYKGSEVIKERDSPKLLSLEVHGWSQQMAVYLPTLTRLQSVLKCGPAMEVLLLGLSAPKNSQLLRVLNFVKDSEFSHHGRLVDIIIACLHSGNAEDVEDVLSAIRQTSSRGAEACLRVLGSRHHESPRFVEIVLASELRAGDHSQQDRLALTRVASLFGISLNIERHPSHLTEVADTLHKQYLQLMTEAQRLENLRLSLRAVCPRDVSKLLAKLRIEASTIVADTLASLPQSLGSLVEEVSENEIELRFPAAGLTRMQRLGIGAGDAEDFLIRLTLRHDGVPIKFCVHLSGESSDQMNSEVTSKRDGHTAWEVFKADEPPHKQYCRGRPNRGIYQLSRMLWHHLRRNFKSLQQTHAHIALKVSRLGQGCLVCGLGQRCLRRGTTCSLQSCKSTFSEADDEIQLVEIWQDPPVMDLLLTMICAAALTGKPELLGNLSASNATTVLGILDALPPISTLAKHLKHCLNVFGDSFHLAQALLGYCNPSSKSTSLACWLRWACNSYRGFLVSAPRQQRIPSFGIHQFLLVNAAPDLEIAFSRHMPAPESTSQILFHGTSLDRLHAIVCQGLRAQSGTSLQRNGALYGPGIYMADEPRVAWSYATTSKGGWKSTKLKNLRVLLGCELAGQKPPRQGSGIYVITDATRLAVRYIFLLENDAQMPAAKNADLRLDSRTAQIEQKIDGLVALLAQPENARESLQSRRSSSVPGQPHHEMEQKTGLSTSASANAESRQRERESESAHNDSSPFAQHHIVPRESYERGVYPPEQRIVPSANSPTARVATVNERAPAYSSDKDLVDIMCAESLLNDFRPMSDLFPFVVISHGLTAQTLRSEKPMLFLAILVTASGKRRSLQITLEEQYRNELATNTIVNAQRSLDCLQSILIYLAWWVSFFPESQSFCGSTLLLKVGNRYHQHFKPQAQQIYQLLQLAISMAIDLGISHKPDKPVMDISAGNKTASVSPNEEREGQRAFLGCYYLSVAFSVALSRPNMLRYSNYMADCCKRLEADQEFPSDNILLHMIKLYHIGDQIHAAFRSEDAGAVHADHMHADHTRSRMLLQMFALQLKEWKRHLPSDTRRSAAMDLSYAFVDMELHSVGIRMGASPASSILPSNTPPANRYRFDLLLSCLEAGKAYLDTLLATPISHYSLFSFIEWMRLPYVLIIVSKLSFPSDSYADTHWDIRTAQEQVRLDLYLESLCYRMSSITTFNAASQPLPDFFLSLRMILERTRHWYVRKTRVASVGDAANTAATGDLADEDSPLEVIRDPHEGTTTGAPTQHHSPAEQTSEPPGKPAPVPTAGMSEATQAQVEATQFPAMAGFEEMDDFMGNIDDTFWTSRLFDPAIFPEFELSS
ncbi:hypothetical protein EPUS_07112 [Endocarpon pusillum Z07020]|uniref:PARP catalytic domain-containing protein n=1 Tax=Endocarpon pusillum (strain Z07020 / HMAS-L-300199) TaxID=1263415 RepID=U1GLB5_ENDPU|nr:uncharacterized protein EPUS_07112 [Endocarpon pusillum Z07020]ERF73018.1 hypothetical protein EPUS_07112 [Endocarpon pusillum Z07020]